MADFTDKDLGYTGKKKAPVDFNGNIGKVQTSTSSTFINAGNYIVLNANGTDLSLRDTLAYRINMSMNNPEVAREITVADLNEAIVVIQRTFELYSLLSIIHRGVSKIAWSYSACDVVSPNIWIATANRGNALKAADSLYARFIEDKVFAAKVCPNVQLAATLAIINAIHRATVKGHTWITANVGNRNSPTYKAIAAAGEMRDDVVKYAGPNSTGHDMFHVFDNDCLDAIAHVLTDGSTLPKDTVVGGIKVGEDPLPLMTLFGIPQGCIDRWPVGMAGKGAIYLGIAEIERVLSCITVVVSKVPIAAVTAAFDAIRTALDDEKMTRPAMLNIKSAIGTMAGFACGFSSADRAGAERISGMVSLNKLVEKHPSSVATGKKLGEYFQEFELNKDTALSITHQFVASLANMLNGISASVTDSKLAGAEGLSDAAKDVFATNYPDVNMAVPEVERKATAKRRGTNLDTIIKMADANVTLGDIDSLDK